jgi:hypothetical protein
LFIFILSKISNFCKARYGVTFLLTEKAEVKGDNQHTVYQWLTQKKYNKSKDVNVRWNFGKFLIDENGKFIDYYASQVAPMGNEITAAIEAHKKGDCKGVQSELHTLKGNSGTLGAAEVHNLCEIIEKKAKVCEFSLFATEIRELIEALGRFERGVM